MINPRTLKLKRCKLCYYADRNVTQAPCKQCLTFRNLKFYVKKYPCFNCGKLGKFQCWQWYNLRTKRHNLAWWCSHKCLDVMRKKIGKGKYHRNHKHKDSFGCAGER